MGTAWSSVLTKTARAPITPTASNAFPRSPAAPARSMSTTDAALWLRRSAITTPGMGHGTGDSYEGITLSGGISVPLPEAHGEILYAEVVDITTLLRALGVYEDMYSMATKYLEEAVV